MINNKYVKITILAGTLGLVGFLKAANSITIEQPSIEAKKHFDLATKIGVRELLEELATKLPEKEKKLCEEIRNLLTTKSGSIQTSNITGIVLLKCPGCNFDEVKKAFESLKHNANLSNINKFEAVLNTTGAFSLASNFAKYLNSLS
ncbi:TPA: hypothetical protein DEO28_02165 [Candidatus Dependentiae bacterium]|nr:MAG: hypothetical protein UR14_C0009G0020 [candidate division TM6 bacterium GW2011_GWE2_31_21]KKP52539.1 MAG: hypothetical protein UR43_C0012G0008 [candidate division TM6 bacterium GW2011_GWF2_33_332]HBS48445.1 hypothetical protein [Candidatus Dependentiae bacterium]HBZ73294.1 hypothetical protein [Candidatus Dependentiae bacterium]